ncbi:hypothetical protein [Actinoplanes sp. NBRC 103695]|uniref:hypothetical protein n=1 Tax=Actinoplanes sp. NBRC 103695 TaxID=3032202 RepID=UPI0024A26F23|nr:hypothetical protein [Actinoplanes sp. NBRC 103695]GLY99561.1 hypothetical protein Acsp02_68140 [Actinoplanes sp. NBRC 103695]
MAISGKAALESAEAISIVLSAVLDTDAGPPPPPGVVDWLARLRLLENVPFAYLVSDPRLLPLESIRFFFLDRTWTDAAVDGALAAGAGTTRERAHLRTRHAQIRSAVDAAEREVWNAKAATSVAYEPGPAEVVTGFLLRSRVVAGWPGLHVRAERAGEPARPLRIERLAPAVLLVLFDGVPDRVFIEEPRNGLQLGFDPPVPPADRRTVRALAGGDVVAVPFRPDAPGVVDVAALAGRLGADDSAALALRLVQLPLRQVFEDVDADRPSFVPSITLDDLNQAWTS